MKRFFPLLLSLVFSHILVGQKHKIDLTEIAKGYYVHTSYNIYQGDTVPSNGIVVDTEGGLVLIETAWGSAQTKALLKVLKRKFHKKVLFCLATHAHEDRIGGTDFLRKKGIPTYTTPLIRQMAIERKLQIPEGTLSNDTTLVVNGVAMRYFFCGRGTHQRKCGGVAACTQDFMGRLFGEKCKSRRHGFYRRCEYESVGEFD